MQPSKGGMPALPGNEARGSLPSHPSDSIPTTGFEWIELLQKSGGIWIIEASFSCQEKRQKYLIQHVERSDDTRCTECVALVKNSNVL